MGRPRPQVRIQSPYGRPIALGRDPLVAAPALPESAVRPARARWRLLVAAATITALVLAFPYSVVSLIRQPNAAIIFIGMALLVVAATRPRHGPNIEDRYTDHILAIPALVIAAAIPLLGPSQFSVFTWLWRLDLLAIPLFALGAIALLAGVRIVWAQRLTLTLLILPWLASVTGIAASRQLIIFGIGSTAAIAFWIVIRRIMRPDERAPALRNSRSIWRPSLVLLLIAIIATAAGDLGLQRFQPLLTAAGQPVIADRDPAPAVPGWALHYRTDYEWIRAYLEPGARWRRYDYAARDLSQPGFVLDRISVSSLDLLSGRGLDQFFRLRGNRELADRSVTLTAGVEAHIVEYAVANQTHPWTAVYWDWPVTAGSSLRYQRIVLSGSDPQLASDASLKAFADQWIHAALAGAGR